MMFIATANVGDTIEVIYHLSDTIPAGSSIYKWHPIDGWREHTNSEFLANGTSVLIRITDGGDGDLDGVANGVVLDPSGVATPAAVGGISSAGGGNDGNYDFTCFIKAARSTSLMKIERLSLILLMSCYIFVLHKTGQKTTKIIRFFYHCL